MGKTVGTARARASGASQRRGAKSASQLVRANSVTRALNIIGDRWTLLILYCAFMGSQRFDEFQRTTGMARSLLADRLKRLVKAGLIRRQLYQRRPARYANHLTEMGADLYDAAMMIVAWEKHWHFDAKTEAHNLRHSVCGKKFTPDLRCSHCRKIVTARDVALKDGPGAGLERRLGPRAQRRSTVTSQRGASQPPMLDRAIELLGDRWTSHVVAAAFYGHRRFNEFQDALRIASNLLSERLARVVELGILEKVKYQSRPARFEYRLTGCGHDVFPLILELMRWGDRWLDKGKGPPEILIHLPCKRPLVPVMTCDKCGEKVTSDQVERSPVSRRKAAGSHLHK